MHIHGNKSNFIKDLFCRLIRSYNSRKGNVGDGIRVGEEHAEQNRWGNNNNNNNNNNQLYLKRVNT